MSGMKPNEMDHIYCIPNQGFVTLDCVLNSVKAWVQVSRFKRQRYICFLGFLERVDRTTQKDSFP